jgi:hypothetical protein
VELEMVETLSEDAVIDAIVILETFVGLLPSEVDEHFF